MSRNEKTPEPTPTTSPTPRRRKRRRLRKMPTPPLPMRALWESASAKQQQEAHQRAVWMLEYWLGRMSKAEAAQTMSVTPLRVWQLSQMAVAGMVCGLLPQPRYRKGMRVSSNDPENDRKALERENARLRAELASAQRLIDVLKVLPGNAGRDLREETAEQAPSEEKEATSPPRRGHSSGARKGRGRRS